MTIEVAVRRGADVVVDFSKSSATREQRATPMPSFFTSLTRRAAIAAGGGLLAAPALTQPVCELGLQGHAEGPSFTRRTPNR
jgi:hypothetical protein